MKNSQKAVAFAVVSLAFVACGNKEDTPVAAPAPVLLPPAAPMLMPTAMPTVAQAPNLVQNGPVFVAQSQQQPNAMIVRVAIGQNGQFAPESASVRALTLNQALPADNAAISTLWSRGQAVLPQQSAALAANGGMYGNQGYNEASIPQGSIGSDIVRNNPGYYGSAGAAYGNGMQPGYGNGGINGGRYGMPQQGYGNGGIQGGRYGGGVSQGGFGNQAAQAWGAAFSGYTTGSQWAALRPVVAWNSQQLGGFAYNSFYANQGYAYFAYRPQSFGPGFGYQVGMSAGMNPNWMSQLGVGSQNYNGAPGYVGSNQGYVGNQDFAGGYNGSSVPGQHNRNCGCDR